MLKQTDLMKTPHAIEMLDRVGLLIENLVVVVTETSEAMIETFIIRTETQEVMTNTFIVITE